MEFSTDLCRVMQAVAKMQPKVKMERVFTVGGPFTCTHTPKNYSAQQVVTLDREGFRFLLGERCIRVTWPPRSEFWEKGEYGTAFTFMLARILKNPKHPYVRFSEYGQGGLKIVEKYGEFQLNSLPALDIPPIAVFSLRSFERATVGEIQAKFQEVTK